MIHLDVKKVGRIPPGGGWRAHGRGTPEAKASTTIGFFCRARAFFAAHGVTRLVRVVTDNGANYRARTFTAIITSLASSHQRIRPYTPRHNGKVERYNRILAEECLYARSYSSEQQRRDAVAVWNHHYNYHRPHTSCHNQPPATRIPTHITNIMTSYIWRLGLPCRQAQPPDQTGAGQRCAPTSPLGYDARPAIPSRPCTGP